MRFYRPSTLRYLVLGVRLQDCYGWGQPIHSPVTGTVVEAEDGWPERNPVHLVRDLAIVLKHALTFDLNRTTTLRPLVGNYIVIGTTDAYAFLAHAQEGSILVSPGDKVSLGQPLARVGHSGNTTAPHLHFHVMDRQDLKTANGIPCCFRDYEVLREGSWETVHNGIPKATDRIRKL
jgi:murein DD-endopeptidase MepM/ murein hydrolase activator NlpD